MEKQGIVICNRQNEVLTFHRVIFGKIYFVVTT